MDDENDVKVEVEIPFPTNRLAEIAYHVLRVDQEPKRSRITKVVWFEDNLLKVVFTGKDPKHLRVATNGFFDNVHLISETDHALGPPLTEKYNHFYEECHDTHKTECQHDLPSA